MQFTKRLHPGIRSGDITLSVRIWKRPHVKVGNRYWFGDGDAIEVDGLREISMDDITPQLARQSGFNGVVDLMKIAKHGRGENVYLVEFHYVDRSMIGPRSTESTPSKRIARATPRAKTKRPARPRRTTP